MIRLGFVSNSSSLSYVAIVPEGIHKENLKRLDDREAALLDGCGFYAHGVWTITRLSTDSYDSWLPDGVGWEDEDEDEDYDLHEAWEHYKNVAEKGSIREEIIYA